MKHATSRKPSTDSQTIKAALALLSNGRATMAEIADLASTSRQLVAFWAKRAGIDPMETRRQYLARVWNRATQSMDSVSPP